MESWDSYHRHLAADLKRLEALLATVLDMAAWAPPEDGLLRMLNPACGRCDEAALLVEWFERRLGAVNVRPSVNLVGADIRAREIGIARDRFRGAKFEFLVSDCSSLSDHGQLGRDFEVVFVRHQNLWFDRKVWTRLYADLLDLLAPEGRLILTSYFDREHMQALELLGGLGAELLVTLRNPLSRELNYPGKSVDRHMAVLRRGAGGLVPTPPPIPSI